MGLSRRQLKRLEGKCGPPPTAVALQEARSREAMTRLTDEELDHLDSALARGFDPQKERQDVLVSRASRRRTSGSRGSTRRHVVRFEGWLRQLERAARGETVRIPQPDGSVARFRQADLADAYVTALDRTLGSSDRDHPLCQAARRSPDPKWSESVYAGPEEVPEPTPNLSE